MLLDGIIAYLTQKHGGNVHTKGIVKWSASSIAVDESNDNSFGEPSKESPDVTTVPQNAADLGTDSIFCSEDHAHSFLCLDFRNMRVAPTSYSIQSSGQESGCHHPKSWVFEVSNDAIHWKIVDRRTRDKDLNGFRVISNFPLASPEYEGYRFVRLRQTGPTWRGTNNLVLSSFEIFGTLIEGKDT